MTVLQLVVFLILLGVGLWLINTYAAQFMSAAILKILNIFVIIVAVLVVINFFFDLSGLMNYSPHRRLGG